MTAIHLAYSQNAARLYQRMVHAFPTLLENGCVLDEDCNATDGWLVFCDQNVGPIQTRIPYSRRALCVNEPSPLNDLPTSFINQFGLLISPYRLKGFHGVWHQTHTGLPWFFGAKMDNGCLLPTMSLQQLMELKSPEKSRTVSVVVSKKVFHDGHRNRLRLLEYLKEKLGDQLLIYGRGIREIDDKANAILPSQLHLVLENTIEPSYWTEKLADAFLGFSLPVYGGCPDIHKWFSPESLLTVNPEDFSGTCEVIRQAISENMYEKRLPAICAARAGILSHETTFHVIARAIAANPSTERDLSIPALISSPKKSSIANRLRREARRIYFQLTRRSRLSR